MITDSFPAMGTTIDVVADDRSSVIDVQRLLADLEGRFSRFISDSELERINRSERREIEVSALMAEVLGTAADLRARTGGLVDPAVGGAVVAWGYDTTFAEIVDLETAPPQTQTPSWSIAGTTLVREPGVKLDLGGIAKGWSVDLAVERGLAHVVSAGGDVRSSLSTASVDVIDPWGQTPARFHLGTGGLATSSVSKRRWRAGDVTAHHLIDPRTGDPAESPVLSATAMCPTAVESEAAAKATLLQGVDGLSWADDQPWIEAVMVVWADGSVFATTGWEVAA